jgi:sarcosine oxidase subunit alpha
MSGNHRRVDDHPVLGPAPRRAEISFICDGRWLTACQGDVLAAALLANGIHTLRAGRAGAPRGLYCAIGHCFECQVAVDGRPGVRACLTPVRDGMIVSLAPPPDEPGERRAAR